MNIQDYESAIADQVKKTSSKGFCFAGIDYLPELFVKENPIIKETNQEVVSEFFKRVIEIVSDNMNSYPLDMTHTTEDTVSSNIWEDITYITELTFPKATRRVECALFKEASNQAYFTLAIWLHPKDSIYNGKSHLFTKMRACFVKQGQEYQRHSVLSK